MRTPATPVVIVGAGPVGLTMALALARQGVACTVLEEREAVCEGSRALGMSRRTLEIWDAVGAMQAIAGRGLPWAGGRSYYRGRTILDFTMPDDAGIHYRPMLNLQQSETEQYLREAVAAQADRIRLLLRHRVEHIEAHGDGVVLTALGPDGPQRFEARFAVACDGARSAVRGLLGLRLEGTSYEAAYVIADIRMRSDTPVGRRCWFDPPSNPGLTVLMHRQPDDVWRLDYQLGADEDAERALEPQRVRERIQQHLAYIGEHAAWSLEWSSLYRVHARALRSFRHGRIFFAGDAAHLMPIFGIRGLNSGIEDAWNLAWKLALVLQGRGEDGLLDSYGIERRAVFLENSALAERNACFMTPPTAGMQLMRDAVLSLALSTDVVQDIVNPRQASYVPLRASPILWPDEDGFTAGPAPGEVVPDLALDGGGHLQQRLGPGFTLLLFVGPDPAADLADLKAEGLPQPLPPGLSVLRMAGAAQHARFGATAGTAYLVRPDHNVMARWRRLAWPRVEQALAHGLGAPGCSGWQAPPTDVTLTPAEQAYRTLGRAIDAVPAAQRTLFLAKLALLAALETDPPGLERLLRAAQPAPEEEEPSP